MVEMIANWLEIPLDTQTDSKGFPITNKKCFVNVLTQMER